MAEISYEKPIPRVSAEQGGRLFRYEFSDPGGRPLSFGVALRLLQEEEGPNSFSAQLSGLLLETKIPAFFWECRPVMPEKLDSTPFEFVVVAAAELEGVPADQNTFEEHFSKPCAEDRWPVASFANLGGDSYLVAPSPVESPPRPYPHLAAFLANAPPQQVAKLWRTVAGVVLTRAEQVAGAANRPFWLSTSGLGVYWLHVRIDRRPKYYTHLPYKDPGY